MKKSLARSIILFLFLLYVTNLSSQVVTLFSEDFSTSSYTTNGWTFPNGQSNWNIGSSNTPSGAVAPNAFFNWATSISNYSVALLSNTINATSINGPIVLNYLLLLNPYSTSTLEQFKVEYKDLTSTTWTLLANYTNSVLAIQNWSVTNVSLAGMAGNNFQIRFTAYGVSSFNLYRWSLDNIVVEATNCPASLPSLTVSGTSTLCSGVSATLTATGGGTSYTWSPAGGNASVAVVSPTTNTTYGLISSIPGCSASPVSAVKSITVFTNSTTLTASSSASSICSGASVTLTAGGSTSYSWSTGASTASVVSTPTSSTIYSVSNINSIGCVAMQTVNVNVNANPVVSAFSTASLICSGSSNNLIANGASSYSWNTGATSAIITVSPLVTTNYTVIGVDTQGCSSTGTITVNVNPIVTIASSTMAVCAGGSLTLTAGGAVSYTWNTSANTAVISATPSSNTGYTVSATDNINCVSSASIGIAVNPNPTVTAVSSNTVICYGSSAILTASGASTYTWSNFSTGATTTVSPLTNATYTVSGKSVAGCTGPNNTATLNLQVNANPTVTAVSSASTVCSDITISLTAVGASTYSWNFGATGTTATISPLVNTTYSVTGTNSLLCSATGTVAVNVLPSPTLTIASSATSICVGSTATLLANGAQTYSWNTGSTVNVIYITPPTNTTYTVSGVGANNCSGAKTIEIVVNPYPVVSITSNDSLICEGEPASITASGATSYSWSNSLNGGVIVVTPLVTTTYTVEGATNGCSGFATFTQSVDVCAGIDTYEPNQTTFSSLYPNPTGGIVIVQFSLININTNIEVQDITGRLILTEKPVSEKHSLDLNELPGGIYYFKISDGKKQDVFKVIKY